MKFRHLARGLRNLINWFTVIWNDRDFDGHYFYLIMSKKLESIEKTFSDVKQIHQIDESRLYILKYVKIARKLLDRIIEDDFNTKNEHEILDKIEHVFVESEDDPNLCELKSFNNPPIEVLREIIKNERSRRAKTRKLFFMILEKRLDQWWD